MFFGICFVIVGIIFAAMMLCFLVGKDESNIFFILLDKRLKALEAMRVTQSKKDE
jgi:hypothetical protein